MPSDAEWTILTNYLGGIDVAGGKLKETGLSHWKDPNTGATNESGFTALPGGYREHDGSTYWGIQYGGNFWTSTEYNLNEALQRQAVYSGSYVDPGSIEKNDGFSVRCIKD